MAYKTEIIKLDVYFDLNTPTDKIRADILASLSKYNGVYSYFSNLTKNRYRVRLNISNIASFNTYDKEYIASLVQYDLLYRKPDSRSVVGFINPPIELYMRESDPLVYNICNRFHKTWSMIEMDDLIQYCRLSIMKLYNKGLYLHPNLIARTFYNDMMMVLRKDPVRIDIDSLDEIAFDNSDDNSIALVDQLEDPAALEQIDGIIESAANDWIVEKVKTIILLKFGKRAYEQLLREYGQFGKTTEIGRKLMQQVKKQLNRVGMTEEWYKKNT